MSLVRIQIWILLLSSGFQEAKNKNKNFRTSFWWLLTVDTFTSVSKKPAKLKKGGTNTTCTVYSTLYDSFWSHHRNHHLHIALLLNPRISLVWRFSFVDGLWYRSEGSADKCHCPGHSQHHHDTRHLLSFPCGSSERHLGFLVVCCHKKERREENARVAILVVFCHRGEEEHGLYKLYIAVHCVQSTNAHHSVCFCFPLCCYKWLYTVQSLQKKRCCCRWLYRLC